MKKEENDMHVCYQELKPYPGYEAHTALLLHTDQSAGADQEAFQKAMRRYQMAEGTKMKVCLI